jgi:hypothetical protein
MLDDIRSAQDDLGKAKCQYCGLNEPSTVDHYLPKSDYPEFCVLAINLLLCCYDCNNRKGETGLINGRRQFVNLYFDSLPQSRYLFATIVYIGDSPKVTFQLQNNGSIQPTLFGTINDHFQHLDLLHRYGEHVHLFISEVKGAVRSVSQRMNAQSVASFLRGMAAEDSVLYGLNSYRVALLFGLAGSSAFIHDCLR